MAKYKITDDIYGLDYFKSIINISNQIELVGELEAYPFEAFTAEFAQAYWHLKYLLLRDGKVIIEKEEIESDLKIFFNEVNLNIMWIDILDRSNYEIKCMDEDWYVEVFSEDANEAIVSKNRSRWILIDNVPG